MRPDLIKVTEIFLVPSSFLVAALGTADTNPHRAMVSLLGLIISALWLVCSREAIAELATPPPDEPRSALPRRTRVLGWLSLVFLLGWLWSLAIHIWLWGRPIHARPHARSPATAKHLLIDYPDFINKILFAHLEDHEPSP